MVIFGDIHKDTKELAIRRMIESSCGSTIYFLFFKASPKDPYYNLLFDGKMRELSGIFCLVEFSSAGSIPPARHLANSGHFNNIWTFKQINTDEDYAKLCGFLNIEKERGEALQHFLANNVRTLVMISNLDDQVTGTDLIKFFRFVGVILDGVILREQRKALIAFQTKSQGSIACSCDGALMASKPISIVLYEPDIHGPELGKLLLQEGEIPFSSKSEYIQLREVLTSPTSGKVCISPSKSQSGMTSQTSQKTPVSQNPSSKMYSQQHSYHQTSFPRDPSQQPMSLPQKPDEPLTFANSKYSVTTEPIRHQLPSSIPPPSGGLGNGTSESNPGRSTKYQVITQARQ